MQIVVQRKSDGAMLAGEHLRLAQLGLLLQTTSYRLDPSDHADFHIFVQSTSHNRIVESGAKVVYVARPEPPFASLSPMAGGRVARRRGASAARPAATTAAAVSATGGARVRSSSVTTTATAAKRARRIE